MLFLRPCPLSLHETPCTDFDVREGNPNGRTVGRIYKDISSGGLWFWCLNDRDPSPAADRGHASSKGEAMLRLKPALATARGIEAGRNADGPAEVDGQRGVDQCKAC